MRIVIDLQGAQGSNRLRNIGRYSLQLALGLARQRNEHEVFIALNGAFAATIEPIRAAFDGMLPQENILVWSAPGPTTYMEPANTGQRQQAEAVREAFLASLDPDWVVVGSLFEGFIDDVVTSIAWPKSLGTAVVLYDLIPWIWPDRYLQHERVRGWYFEKLDHLRRADLLLAISESSRCEAIDYLGFKTEQVINVSAAADARFAPLPVGATETQRLAEVYGLRRPFVMYAGGIDPRKNIEGLIAAYARLSQIVRARHQLVITCAIETSERKRLRQLARAQGLGPDEVVFTGYVPDDDLRLLYNACTLFVFPSWHEGFGLPVLEAMQCGRPVLASNRSSLPEVVGRSDALFDPFDVADMAAKIEQALTDQAFRSALAAHGLEQAKKFSWEETARLAWAALSQQPARAVPPARRLSNCPRLAFVSPLPPEKSGIADYSAELLRELTRWYRIDVVLKEPRALTDDYVRATCGALSVAEFRAQAHRYPRVLYHFGNSEFHDHMFELLAEIPGVVVLHDFFLADVLAWREGRGRPYDFCRALFHSHGYAAVAERFQARDIWELTSKYPANLPVLQDALGVIVHSEFSRRLAELWYGKGAGRNWAVIPLLRAPALALQRKQARAFLGLPEEALVVCSFGVIGPIKLSHRLVEAWLASRLAKEHNARLVLVGEASGDFGERLRKQAAAGGITVTGWVDTAAYRTWLAAADIAVQLRTLTRGETSAAVLDCMNYGLATIVNAHGTLAELDDEAVLKLPDEFSDAQLIEALETLAFDSKRRRALGVRARECIRTRHNPRRCAEAYAQAIEEFYAQAEQGAYGVMRRVACTQELAVHLARSFPPAPRRRQLLIDISVLAQHDLKTGIQRVVRALLQEYLRTPPTGWAVEPVYATEALGYRYARRFVSRFLEIPEGWAEDEPVEAWPGDVFLGLDWVPTLSGQQDRLLDWHRRGVKVYFVVYDLLPVLLPQCFPAGAEGIFHRWLQAIARFDGAACISRAVADELLDWLGKFAPARERPFSVGWFHLGADIENSKPTLGMPANAPQVLENLSRRPSFLMVGTLEPRKGHSQVLDAFDLLWRSGLDANLVMVGKQGWMVEELVARLRNHPELNKRLFWLEGISDEYLEKVYAASTCLIAASYGEGFGLPLIEAAQHGLPIIARDMPVFREVAGEHAFYFANDRDPATLAKAIASWLELAKLDKVPPSCGLRWQTWKQSAQQLLNFILGERQPYRTWSSGSCSRSEVSGG